MIGGRFYVPASWARESLELAEELPGDGALAAALDFGDAALRVGLGLWILAHADHHDRVQRSVELKVFRSSGHGVNDELDPFSGRDSDLEESCCLVGTMSIVRSSNSYARMEWR